jgi:hypothetical protein
VILVMLWTRITASSPLAMMRRTVLALTRRYVANSSTVMMSGMEGMDIGNSNVRDVVLPSKPLVVQSGDKYRRGIIEGRASTRRMKFLSRTGS